MSETLTDPLLGRVVDGRYEIREHVATGGMASVYVAFDKRLEREVALKAMHQPLVDDAASREFVARFRREAKSSARLTHPGIVHVYDQGIDGDLSYLTMEYVRGENLRSRIAHEGTLTIGEALALSDAILDALATAHRLGLVHRDVKPENVLIDTDGRARITDFGLARAVTDVGSNPDTVIMGSPGYLAPELLARGEAAPTMDVYAVGVMLFEMVTGRHPFTGESAVAIAARHVHEDIPAPSTFAPWLPTEFDDLVAALASRDAADRPADAAGALVLVRSTRALMDDPTLDRRADPPSGALAITHDPDATTVLDTPAAGATVALPVGIGRPFAAVGTELEAIDDDPDAMQPSKPQRRAGWWVGAILAAIVLLGAVGLWWYNAVGPGAYTTIPAIAGESAEDANRTLVAAGFIVHSEERNDDEVPEGFAVGTDPEAQQQVQRGSEVTLIVSLGPKMTKVPSVVGYQEEKAEATLTDDGFTVGEPTLKHSDTVPKGEVMGSTPKAGETVRHDSVVKLEVSDGPAPVTIPKVTGMGLDEAQTTLEDAGLKVTVEHGRTEKVEAGEIYKQDPKAKAEGHRTDTVTIWVSDGPPLVTVNDYVGMDYEDGVAAAKADGFDVSTTGRWGFLSDKNSIVDQSLSPGQEVEKGTTLVLVYN
ncbi:Stk1 family PASTA domain-containing Ser/Thr kinase [Demequina sp.]|uniref:Stk1 family PASTA domain-containing Ser/Thr kinase n=1 Tax=Demequina sp. TaxID=2050685 RepID=UPI003D13E417